MILRKWTGDIYTHPIESMYNSLMQVLLNTTVSPEDGFLTVKIVPTVHLVGAGVALMSDAAAISLARN